MYTWKKNSSIKTIVDVCSGSGGPTPDVHAKLVDKNIRTVLTDLFPHISYYKVKAKQHANLLFVDTSMDATRLDLFHAVFNQQTTFLRSMYGCFHHFHPDMIESMLEDTMKHGDDFIIAETFLDRTDISTFLLPRGADLPPALLPLRKHQAQLGGFGPASSWSP